METITYTQVQQLVEKLPETQLALAYHLLLGLVEERQTLLSQQAEQMKIHYKQTADERTEWQSGDFIDEHETRGDLVS